MRSVATTWLQRALQRVQPARTVMVSEYPLAPEHRWGWGKPAHPELAALLAERNDEYAAVIDRLLDARPLLERVPSWDNDWWAGLDAAVHLLALVERRPATYLEIGSGYSTMLARHAVDAHGLPTRIVSVDPNPRADIDPLCDEVVRRRLEDVGPSVADRLTAGDVLLVDGSHMATMGCDTVVALLEILPRLPAGVLVAVDDVFLPFDYHPTWADRWYGEQYVLAAFLLGGGGGYEVRFPGLYVTQHPALGAKLDALWPLIGTRFGRVASAIWLERTT